jgi:hypothetical protein
VKLCGGSGTIIAECSCVIEKDTSVRTNSLTNCAFENHRWFLDCETIYDAIRSFQIVC